MNYLASGINVGFQAGSEGRREKKRGERAEAMRAADEAMQRDLLDQRLTAGVEERNAREAVLQDKLAADAKRAAEVAAAREADPVFRLERAKAQLELDTLGKPKPLAPPTAKVTRKLPGDASAVYDMPLTDLEKSFGPAQPPASPPAPTARVSQAFGADGKSRAEFNVPLDEAKRMAGAAAYKSPYGEEIASLGSKIAEHEAEIQGGDTRTGFLGIATSRQGEVDKAKRQQRRLQAMEIQDALARGVIDQAEADRRANRILSTP